MRHKDYILYIEDDEIDAIKFAATLKNLNFSEDIVTKENGQEGLDWLFENKNQLPKIIVLDLNMPKMGGLEFMEAIKADEILKKIPIIVFTTSDEKIDIQRSFQYQVSGYMVKPFDQKAYSDIIILIKEYWDKSATGHF